MFFIGFIGILVFAVAFGIYSLSIVVDCIKELKSEKLKETWEVVEFHEEEVKDTSKDATSSYYTLYTMQLKGPKSKDLITKTVHEHEYRELYIGQPKTIKVGYKSDGTPFEYSLPFIIYKIAQAIGTFAISVVAYVVMFNVMGALKFTIFFIILWILELLVYRIHTIRKKSIIRNAFHETWLLEDKKKRQLTKGSMPTYWGKLKRVSPSLMGNKYDNLKIQLTNSQFYNTRIGTTIELDLIYTKKNKKPKTIEKFFRDKRYKLIVFCTIIIIIYLIVLVKTNLL